MYVGQWKFGKCDGLGIYSVFLPDTKQYAVKYQGGWKNGKKHVCMSAQYSNVKRISLHHFICIIILQLLRVGARTTTVPPSFIRGSGWTASVAAWE